MRLVDSDQPVEKHSRAGLRTETDPMDTVRLKFLGLHPENKGVRQRRLLVPSYLRTVGSPARARRLVDQKLKRSRREVATLGANVSHQRYLNHV